MRALHADRPRKPASVDNEEEPATQRRPGGLHVVPDAPEEDEPVTQRRPAVLRLPRPPKAEGSAEVSPTVSEEPEEGSEDASEDRISGVWKKAAVQTEKKRVVEAAQDDATVKQLREKIQQIPRSQLNRPTMDALQTNIRKATLHAEQKAAKQRKAALHVERERLTDEINEDAPEMKDLKWRMAKAERDVQQAKEALQERAEQNARVQEMLDAGTYGQDLPSGSPSRVRHDTMRKLTEKYSEAAKGVTEKEDAMRTAKQALEDARYTQELAEVDELERIVTEEEQQRAQELAEIPDVPEPSISALADEPDLDNPIYALNTKSKRGLRAADVAIAAGIAGLVAHNVMSADTEPNLDQTAKKDQVPDGQKKPEAVKAKPEERTEATPHRKMAMLALGIGAGPGILARLWKSFVKFDTAFQKDPLAAIAGLFFSPDDK